MAHGITLNNLSSEIKSFWNRKAANGITFSDPSSEIDFGKIENDGLVS